MAKMAQVSIELSPNCKLLSQCNSSTITIDELCKIRDRISHEGNEPMTLIEMMKGSKLVFPSKNDSTEPSDALKKRREYLKLRNEEREYYKLSGTVSG